MFEVFDYDDERGDVEILPDSPNDSTFVQDGLIVFSQRNPLVTEGE